MFISILYFIALFSVIMPSFPYRVYKITVISNRLYYFINWRMTNASRFIVKCVDLLNKPNRFFFDIINYDCSDIIIIYYWLNAYCFKHFKRILFYLSVQSAFRELVNYYASLVLKYYLYYIYSFSSNLQRGKHMTYTHSVYHY